jgi:hypothetical protein
MIEWPEGGIGFQPRSLLINLLLDWCKEPFSSGLLPQTIDDLLASRGFVMKEMFSSRELAEEYGLDPIELEGGNLVACEGG